MENIFHYISPLIIPILPGESGFTVFGLQLAKAIRFLEAQSGDTSLAIKLRCFSSGNNFREEEIEVPVTAGVPDRHYLEWRFEHDELGYAEVSIVADRPYFRKIYTEHSHGVVERPDGGTFNLNPMFKFSDPAIIRMMRDVGEFCLVHPGQFVSAARNIGNSTLIVNPFDGPILATLMAGDGRTIKKRIGQRTASMISLTELLEDEKWSCVRFSGNNRYPAWDVRHEYRNPEKINRIDHVEYYRGDLTLRQLSASDYLRSRVRRILRNTGMRT